MDKSNYITRYYKVVAGYGTKKHREEACALAKTEVTAKYLSPYAFYYVTVFWNNTYMPFSSKIDKHLRRVVFPYWFEQIFGLSCWDVLDVTDTFLSTPGTGKPFMTFNTPMLERLGQKGCVVK